MDFSPSLAPVLRAGIIGCGRPKTANSAGGQAQRHVAAYQKPGLELVALSDIAPENLDAFRAQHGGQRTYLDFREMLEKEELDIVSICTWPALHEPMVIACAEAGVKLIYCEKPMAPSYGASKRMFEACRARGAILGFNHQRRFGEPFVKARQMVEAGEIGELLRVEGECGDLFDWGTHWFDMMFFYNGETPVEWVFGQADWRGARKVFGAPLESQGLSQFKFENGVMGLLVTRQGLWPETNCLVGSRGVIEVGGPTNLRVLGRGEGRQEIPTAEGLHAEECVERAIGEFIEAARAGRLSQVSADKALRASELIFATYESSRRRGRVELPLDIEDSPLQAMLDENGVQL